MHTVNPPLPKLLPLSLLLAMLAGFGIPMQGQQPPKSTVEDWTHHRLVFSSPGTVNEAEAKGRYEQWTRIVNDRRFQMQQLKRTSGEKTVLDTGHGLRTFKKPGSNGNEIHQDWTKNMLSGGQVQPNMYPAKFSFDTATASCTNDFVAYPTGVAGSGTAADVVAYTNLYTGGCTGTVPSISWAYNTGGTVSTSPVLLDDATGSQLAYVQVTGTAASLVLLKWAPSPTTFTVVGSVTISGANLTFTSGSLTVADVGAQVSGTGIPAHDTIASITGPTTGTLATAATSGTITMTVSAETLSTPGVPPTAASASAYRSCTTPCMYTVSLGANDTFSAPFYDYTKNGDDAIYVGDDSGKLHKIAGVFRGTTIAEAMGWPVTLNAADKTTSPVYDSTSGYVFAGNTGAILYAVGTGNAGTTNASIHGTSGALGGTGAAIIDAPLVDSAAGKVYAFVSNGENGSAGVFQFLTSFTTGTGSEQTVGVGATQYWLYDGDFDNVYYSSTGGTAGNLWVLGNTGETTPGLTGVGLFRIPITGTGTMGTAVSAIGQITKKGSGNHGFPSPITEFCNNGASPCVSSGTATTTGTDYIFFSVDQLTSTTGTTCLTGSIADGCILAYNISTGAPVLVGGAATTSAGTNGCWATGGIVIDNSVPSGTLAGASQLYTYELNGNGAGGPTSATYTSTGCTNSVTATPIALQDTQAL